MRRLALLVLAVASLAAVAEPAEAAPRDGRLRPVAGFLPDDGVYEVSGTLDGIRPPSRPVRSLRIARLIGPTAEGLQPLVAFPELRELEIEAIEDIDVAPLAGLRLKRLTITRGRGLDLTPLGSLSVLEELSLRDLRDCRIPPALALPSTLEDLFIGADGFRLTGEPVKALVDAIDWPRLGALQYLGLHVGGVEWLRPVRVDLGLLRYLPRLRQLDIGGVWHDGSGPSPLTPPFEGRPDAALGRVQRLASARGRAGAQAPPAGPVHLGRPACRLQARRLRVLDALAFRPPLDHLRQLLGRRRRPRRGDRDHLAGRRPPPAARRRPRAARRLDFDPEADGTGISAPTRRDLVRMLRILDIRDQHRIH